MGKRLAREDFENAVRQRPEPGALNIPEQENITKKQAYEFIAQAGGSTPDPGMEAHPESQYGQNYLQAEQGYEQHLGRVQPPLDEFSNMLARAGLNIVPGLIGSVAAIADPEDYLAGITQQDEVGNAVTRWADDWKKRTNQQWAPIYRQDPNKPLDFGSTEWWADNGSGLIESAGEFAILGFGIGGLLTKGMQATEWLKALTTVTDTMTGVSRLNKAAEITALGTNAFLLNHAEGMLEATQVYGSELEKNMQLVKEGKITEEQARLNAGAAAGHTLNINRANILLNLTGVSGIMKGARGSRNLIRSLSTPQKLILEGGQEYLEESINFYASNRGAEYGEALREGKEYVGLSAERFVEDVLSARGVEAGILGALGGIAQTAAVGVGKKIRGGEDIEKTFEAEQKAIGKGYEDLRNENKLKSVRDLGIATATLADLGGQRANLEADIQKAKDEGVPVSNELIAEWQNVNNQIQDQQLYATFQSGTTEYTEKAYKDIENLTETEALKNGFTGSELDPKSPAYYKHTARRMQERLTALEKEYSKTQGYGNAHELFLNRNEALRIKDQLTSFTKKESVLLSEAQAAADRLGRIEKMKNLPFTGEIDVTRLNEPGYEKLENVKDPDVTLYRKDLIHVAKNLPEMQALAKTQEAKKEAQKALDQLDTEYSQQTTFEHQEKLRQEVEAAVAEKKAKNESDLADIKAAQQHLAAVEAKTKLEHEKNAAASRETLRTTGVEEADVTAIQDLITKEINTPIGQEIQYTSAEEALLAKYPQQIANHRKTLNAAVLTDVNVLNNKPNEMVYTTSDNEAVEAELISLETTGLDASNTTLVDPEADEKDRNKLDRGNNVIAWLSRAYSTFLDAAGLKHFADVDNKISDELKDPTILDARTLKIGDDVELRIDPTGVVPDVDKDNNEVLIPWAEYKTTNAGNTELLEQNAPIGIYRPGETTPVGYVHLANWINSSRVKGSDAYILAEKKKVTELRRNMKFAGPEGTVKTKIVQRTLGKLFLDANKQPKAVSENLKDSSLDYVVFFKGRLLASDKSTRDTDKNVLNRNSLKSGITYVLLPVEKNVKPELTKYWAVPLKINKISEPIVNSVARATEVWLNKLDNKLTPEDNAIAEAIMAMQQHVLEDGSPVNFDIRTEEGIINYTELYVYNHTTNDVVVAETINPATGDVVKSPDVDFDKYFIQKNKSLRTDYLAHKINRKKGLQFGSGQKGVTPNVDMAQYMQAWRDHLAQRYQHSSLRFLNNNTVKLPLINQDNTVSELAPGNTYLDYLKQNAWSTNVVGQNIAKDTEADNYVYTIQQIIEFDTSIFGIPNEVTTEEIKQQRAQEEIDKLREINEAKAQGKKLDPLAAIKAQWEADLKFINSTTDAAALLNKFPVKKAQKDQLPQLKAKAIKYVNKKQETAVAALGKVNIQDQIAAFAARLVAGEELIAEQDIAFFNANKTKINALVKKLKKAEAKPATVIPPAPVIPPLVVGTPAVTHVEAEKESGKVLDRLFPKGFDDEEISQSLPALKKLTTAVTGEVVVTNQETLDNVAEETRTQEILAADLLKNEAAYQNLKSKYTLPPSKFFDNAILRDLLSYWTDDIVNNYNQRHAANAGIAGKAEYESIQEILNELRNDFEQSKAVTTPGKRSHALAVYVTDNWDVIQNLIKYTLQRDSGFNFKKYKYTEQDQDENNRLKSIEDMERDPDDADNADESRSVKERWMLDSLQQDPAKGLSSRFRRFLGGLKDTSRHYLVHNDKNPNFKAVRLYRTLSALLSDMDPDFDAMMRVLDKMGKQPGFEYLNVVRQALENADEQIKAEFVVTMSKHYVNMKHLYVISRQGQETYKVYEGLLRDDNYVAKREVIKDRWEHDMYLSAIAREYDGSDLREGRMVYDKDEVNLAIEMFEQALLTADGKIPTNKKGKPETVAKMDPQNFHLEVWLGLMGIQLSPTTKADLLENGNKPSGKKGTYRDMFYAKDGEFWNIYQFLHRVAAIDGDVFMENLSLASENAVHKLAAIEARHTLDAFSNSHRSGNKSIFSYTDNKYAFDRARQLGAVKHKSAPDLELFERLVASPFVGKNSWDLRQMLDFDEATQQFKRDPVTNQLIYNPDSDYNKNFAVAYTSLSALIEKGVPVGSKNALEDLDHKEHLITKFMMFQNHGIKPTDGKRRGQLFHMTLSNKNTMLLFEKSIPPVTLGTDGKISEATVAMLFNYAVMPEIKRMYAYDKNFAPNIKDYNHGHKLFYIFPQLNLIDELFEGTGVNRFLKKDIVTSDGTITTPAYKALIYNAIKSTISTEAAYTQQSWAEAGMLHTDDQGTVTRLDYVDGSYKVWVKKQIGIEGQMTPEGAVANYAATEMAVAYMLHDTNLFQLFTTDPATQFKTNNVLTDSPMQQVINTYDNIGKRLGGEISPGRDPYTQLTGSVYSLAVMEDIKLPSKAIEAYRKLFKDNPKALAAFDNINTTDGAEFITLPEKLRFMREFAKLSPDQIKAIEGIEKKYNQAIAAIKAGKDSSKFDLNFEELDLIFQIDKPIMVGTRVDAASKVETKLFVKSAAFTLIPQLVRDTELRHLMAFMSNPDNKIDRLAMSSAVKLGAPAQALKLFDANGNFDHKAVLKPADVFVVPRKHLRLQQETPYKETTEITRVTQASKLAFLDMLGVKDFRLPGSTEDVTGKDLNQTYLKHYDFLYKNSYNELVEELGIKTDTAGKVSLNHKKLNNLIQNELTSRGYPAHDLDALEIEQFPPQEIVNGQLMPLPPGTAVTYRFKMPIWAAAKSGKLEAFLNSIITNRILKQKFNGYAFVLGPEGGYKFQPSADITDVKGKALTKGVVTDVKDLNANLRSKIIFTDKFDAATGLKPGLINNGWNQVILPWKFQESLSQYITNGKLDTSKLSPELLKIFGMRIPTQGHNSMAAIEVVGFFPKEAGDLMVAPADFVTKMGADFDIDKLYTYLPHYTKDEAGNLTKVVDPAESVAYHQNQILDIHLAIHTNMNPQVQKLINMPLTTVGLKDIADEIEKAKMARGITEAQLVGKVSPHDLSPASGSYQSFKYQSSVIANQAIGAFAVQNTFNSLAQAVPGGLNMVKGWDLTGTITGYSKVRFGEESFTGRLSKGENRYGNLISTHISAMLSAAVDDEKEQILGRIGLNDQNISVVNFMLQAGFELDTISRFISQDIIQEYTKQKAIFKGNVTKAFKVVTAQKQFAFTNDKFKDRGGQKPKTTVKSTIPVTDDPKDATWEPDFEANFRGETLKDPTADRFWKFYNMGSEELMKYIVEGEKAAGYKEAQYALLKKYMDLDKNQAGTLRRLQSMSNIDSKGMGANMFQSLLQQRDIEDLVDPRTIDIENASKLFGDFKSRHDLNPEDEAKLVAQGYIKGKQAYIKPTSIPGFALAYGVMTNNKIWQEHFPYAKDEVLNTVEQVAKKMKEESENVFIKAEQYRKIFMQLKSYSFTDNTLTIVDPVSTRKMLLHDYSNPDGSENYSLATIMKQLQENDVTAKLFRENAFLSNLYANSKKDSKLPRIVLFRQPSDDEVTNRDIYNEVYNLVKYPVDFGEFNGIKYNSRKFIEHLMLAANVSMQSSLQLNLMQYMPTELLVDMGYAESLHKYNWSRLQQNAAGEPYRATIQYFQHSPHLAPEIEVGEMDKKSIVYGHDEITDEELKTGVTLQRLQEAAAGNALNIKQFTLGPDAEAAPSFYHLKVKDPKGEKVLLFRLIDSVTKEYSRIPTLLNSLTSNTHEYNANKEVATSILPQNNPSVLTVPSTIVGKQHYPSPPPGSLSYPQDYNQDRAHNIERILNNYGLRKSEYNISPAQLDKVLETIVTNSGSPQYQLIAAWLRTLTTLKDKTFDVSLVFKKLENDKLGKSSLDPKTGKVTVIINPFQTDSDGGNLEFEHTLLHEMVHAVTQFALLQGKQDIRVRGELGAVQRRAFKNLNKLYEDYKAMYLTDKEGANLYDELLAEVQERSVDERLTPEERNHILDFIYPGKSIEEFVVAIMTRPALRQRLQTLKYSEDTGESFWDKIVAVFDMLLKAMGLAPDSTAGKAVKDVMFLTDVNNQAFVRSSTSQIPIKIVSAATTAAEEAKVKTELTKPKRKGKKGKISEAIVPEAEDVQSAEVAKTPEEIAIHEKLYKQVAEDNQKAVEQHEKETFKPVIIGGVQQMPPFLENLFDPLDQNIINYLPNFLGNVAAAAQTASGIKKPPTKSRFIKKTRIPKVSLRVSELISEREFNIQKLGKHLAELQASLRDPLKTRNREEIKNLQKRVGRVKETREELLEEVKAIGKLTTTESILKIGDKDLNTISTALLSPDKLTFRDIHILETKLGLWLNYENNFLEDEDKKSALAHAAFSTISSTARSLQASLSSIKEEMLYNWAKDYLKRDISLKTFYAASKDIGGLAAQTLGLDNSDLAITQAVTQAVMIAEAEEVEDYFLMAEDMRKLIAAAEKKEHITGKNFSNFFEKDEAGITGRITRAYSKAFEDQKQVLRDAIHAAVHPSTKNKARKALDKFRKENELFFDLRKLTKLEGFEAMHAADAGKLEAELKKVLGEVRYQKMLKKAQDAYRMYLDIEENQLEHYEVKHEGDPEHIKNAMNVWKNRNSLINYWDYMTNPQTAVNGSVTQWGWVHAKSVPKATNAAGTSLYSEQFLKLQSDPDVAALHNYMVDLLEKLYDYIPIDQRKEFAANSIPALEKDLIEMFKTEGIAAAGVSFWDKIKMGFTSQESNTHQYGANNSNRSLDLNVQTLTGEITDLFAQKVRDYERSTGHVLDEAVAADQAQLAKYKAEATAEVQQRFTLDLPKILAVYSKALTTYKYKARIEDAVRVTEEVFLSSAKENLENAAGQAVDRFMPEGQRKPEYVKESHKNHKEMVRNFTNHFFGVAKPIEGQAETKLLTTPENRRREVLKAELAKHQAELTALEKELSGLQSTTDGLTTAQAEQRSKDVTEIDTKLVTVKAKVEEVSAELQALGQHITATGATNSLIKALIVKGLGWNIFGGLTNVFIGTMSNYIESAGQRWYTEKEMRQGLGIALNSTVKAATGGLFANEVAKKLNVLMRRFDILKSVTQDQFRDSTVSDEFLGTFHWAQVYKTSEYMNQGSVLAAMMLHVKVKDLAGNEASLWEAFGTTGEWDSKRFGDINAAESAFKAYDRALFKAKVDKVIRNNHGNYAKNLEIALKEKSLGKLLAVFRGWMFEGFRTRWEGILTKGNTIDYVDDFERKGRYKSYAGSSLGLGLAAIGTAIAPGLGTAVGLGIGSLIGSKIRDSSRFKEEYQNMSAFKELELTTKYLIRKLSFGAMFRSVDLNEQFTETDAINLRRNMAEISFMLYVTGAMMVLAHLVKGEDDDDWKKRALMYNLNVLHRMQQDLGFYANPVTAQTVLQDPMPALGLVSDVMEFISATSGAIADPESDKIPTGIYAGESRWWRSFQKQFPGTKAWKSFWSLTEQELRD